MLLSQVQRIRRTGEPFTAEEPSSLLMRADAALYRAKMHGRDCVVVEATELEPVAKLADSR